MITDDASIMSQCVQDFRQLPPDSLRLEPEWTPVSLLAAVDRLPTMAYVALLCDAANELLEHTYAADFGRVEWEGDDLRAKLEGACEAQRLASTQLRMQEQAKLELEGETARQVRRIDCLEWDIQREEVRILELTDINAIIEIDHSQSCIKEANEELNRLRPQLSATRAAIAEMEPAVNRLRIEAAACQSQVDKSERSLKTSGRLLAELKDARAFLRQLRAQYTNDETIQEPEHLSQSLEGAAIEIEA